VPRAAMTRIILCVAMAGCAPKPPPFDPGALRASMPRTLIVAADRSPPITAEGRAHEGFDVRYLFGVVGALAVAGRNEQAARRRGRWMKGCQLDDPVDDIRDDVAEALADALSLHVLDSDRRTKAKAPEDVIADYPGADLILDIRTSKWGIRRVAPQDDSRKVHFAAVYEGTVRLIDARKRAVIVESTCWIQYSNGGDQLTITELLADDCALLDKGLTLSANTCAQRHRAALGLE